MRIILLTIECESIGINNGNKNKKLFYYQTNVWFNNIKTLIIKQTGGQSKQSETPGSFGRRPSINIGISIEIIEKPIIDILSKSSVKPFGHIFEFRPAKNVRGEHPTGQSSRKDRVWALLNELKFNHWFDNGGASWSVSKCC